jgi:hypothetical protein
MATEKVVDVEHLLGQRCVLGGVQRWKALEHRGVVSPSQHWEPPALVAPV